MATKKKAIEQEEVQKEQIIEMDNNKREHKVIIVSKTYIIAQRPEGDNIWMPLDKYPAAKVGDILYL